MTTARAWTGTRTVYRSAGAAALVEVPTELHTVLLAELPAAPVVNDEAAQDARKAA